MFNSETAGIVVHKFGGTSIGKFPNRVADIIASASTSSSQIAVVCSARSPDIKVRGITSRLLEVHQAIKRLVSIRHDARTKKILLDKLRTAIYSIRDEHISVVHSTVQSPEIQDEACQWIDGDCQYLLDYINAAGRFNLNIDACSKDRIASFGEKLSCRLMTALLKDRRVDAAFVDLSEVMLVSSTDYPQHKYFNRAADIIGKHISACDAQVPVITGFFGSVPGGLLDGAIARGYSDVCAALVAVGLAAKKLRIWKEVDGILTADPTEVPNARLLAAITPAEAQELTFYGSEVVHHISLTLALQAVPRVEVSIKNVQNPGGHGTLIIPDTPKFPGEQTVPIDGSAGETHEDTTNGVSATAISIKRYITVLNLYSNKKFMSHGFFAKVFNILEACHISVDLISTSEVYISMAIHTSDANEAQVTAAQIRLGEVACVNMLPDMALVSLVGRRLKNKTGIAGKMFSILGENGVNIEMISQGASEISISCVISDKDATKAINVLHTHLIDVC